MLKEDLHKLELHELRRDVSELRAQVNEVQDLLNDLTKTIARYQGAWGAVIMVGGAVLAALRYLAEHVNFK